MSSLEIRVDPREYGFDPLRLQRIEEHFARYVDDQRLAGWLITVGRAGEVVWRGSGGYRDREHSRAVSDDTIWRIYSMTKPITSLAVMMLYEEGHFDLNDDVGRWIDSFRAPRVYVGGPSNRPETVPAVEPVRVQHLLSHTSGLTYGFHYSHPVDEIYRTKGYDFDYTSGANLASAVDDWATCPLLFQPGSAWNYSVGVDVLGRLVEIWSGMSLDRFVKERITDPLGMTDTEWWCPPEKIERLAALYVPGPDGVMLASERLRRGAVREPRLLGGGAGLLSTASDYQRFMTMLLRRGELDGVRLVSARTVDLMTRNHLPEGRDLAHSATGSFSESDYAGVGFGLGFSVVVDAVANKSLISEGSYAWGGAASTAFWIDPSEELTVGLYTQLLPSGTYPLRRELHRLLYQALRES